MQLGAVQAEQNSFSDELLDGLGCDPDLPATVEVGTAQAAVLPAAVGRWPGVELAIAEPAVKQGRVRGTTGPPESCVGLGH